MADLRLETIIARIQGSTPVAFAAPAQNLLDSVALPSSNDWKRTGDDSGDAGIICVEFARRVGLYLKYNAAAAGGFAEVIPLLSAAADRPAADDDSWYVPFVPDGTMTDVTLAGTLPTGTDFTAAPSFAKLGGRLLVIATKVAANAADKIRRDEVLDVTEARWLQFLYHEGSAVAVGTLQADFNLAI